ncbi:glycosyltransferase [Antribacter gilvus]|uniref:glycosyltransferase n=1 Tax=Antribacter gilvus TaxID=2304675 RepID=UPI000F7B8B05|nr:glycosyltransferase [Antribacter gilvus]
MIVSFGTYDADRHPRVAVLVAGLRANGVPVREVNRPLGLSTAERVRMLQQPWRLPVLALRLLACWSGLVAGALRARREDGAPQAVLVGYMGHFDVVLARLLYPRTTIVLDHLIFAGDTAVDRGASGLRSRLLTGLDRLATASADVVVTDTDEHRQMLRRPGKGVVVLVGAADTWFEAGDATARSRTEGDPLRVIFYGLFTPLQGTPVIAEAVARAVAAGVPLQATIVGTGQDEPAVRLALSGVDGVTWHDWVAPRDMPALVAAHDVCLGIFSDTPKGVRVVPNKVYQGLAAGCVVVTSDTPPQRRTVGDFTELVPPADPAALAARLSTLADPDRLDEARARARAGRAGVRPSVVVAPLVEVLRTAGVLG